MLRLLALRLMKYPPSTPGMLVPRRPWSPWAGSSTLMTSAPSHARSSVQDSSCLKLGQVDYANPL